MSNFLTYCHLKSIWKCSLMLGRNLIPFFSLLFIVFIWLLFKHMKSRFLSLFVFILHFLPLAVLWLLNYFHIIAAADVAAHDDIEHWWELKSDHFRIWTFFLILYLFSFTDDAYGYFYVSNCYKWSSAGGWKLFHDFKVTRNVVNLSTLGFLLLSDF